MPRLKSCLLFLSVVFLLVFSFVPLVQNQEVKNANITFQPNSIPDVNVYYQDYSFVFEYKTFFIRIRPFAIYNGTYYDMKQIVTWIKTNYPNVNYTWLIDKAEKAIHYGFNLTKLPQNVADKINYLGFRLVDLNFPLSFLSLERTSNNLTEIHIPRANLAFSFKDLFQYGYKVGVVNKTYILVGDVKGEVDLYFDPLAYSSGIITLTGYSTEGTGASLWDIWNASNANGWGVFHNNNESNVQYQSDARIYVGDGENTTWLVDTGVQLFFSNLNSLNLIWVKTNSSLRFGKVLDSTARTSEDGVSVSTTTTATMMIQVANDANLYLYSSKFHSDIAIASTNTVYIRENNKIWETDFDNVGLEGAVEDADIYRVNIKKANYALEDVTGTLQDILVEESDNAALLFNQAVDVTFANGTFKNNNRLVTIESGNADIIFIDCTVDTWNFLWYSSNVNVLRKNTFSLTITYPNGTAINGTATGARAVIQHYGNNSAVDYNATLGEDGTISTQTLTMGFYNQTGGNTIYDYNPYGLTIYNASGYQTYTKNFTLSDKTRWTIALTPTPQPAPSTILAIAGFAFVMFTVATAIFILKRKKASPEA